MDERWCRLWCDRASAVVTKLSAVTATRAIPKYLKTIKLFLQRLSEHKTGADKRFPKRLPAGWSKDREAARIISEYLSRDRAMPNKH
jgi:hypothetical protein